MKCDIAIQFNVILHCTSCCFILPCKKGNSPPSHLLLMADASLYQKIFKVPALYVRPLLHQGYPKVLSFRGLEQSKVWMMFVKICKI